MINRCRNFIFATAPSPFIAALVRAALPIVEAADDRRAALAERVARIGEGLARLKTFPATGTHIQPIVVGPDHLALTLAARLQAAGFDIRGIRPPTVPEGSSRLRISVTLNAAPAEIDAMLLALEAELARETP